MNRRRRPQRGFGQLVAAIATGGGGRAKQQSSDLIGRDLAQTYLASDTRASLVPAALIGLLLAAMFLVALRVDGIHQRYALADSMSEQKLLLEKRAKLTAQVRTLRDPARLAQLASQRSFRRPDRVVELPAPAVTAELRP